MRPLAGMHDHNESILPRFLKNGCLLSVLISWNFAGGFVFERVRYGVRKKYPILKIQKMEL